jgi:hypothetical protein
MLRSIIFLYREGNELLLSQNLTEKLHGYRNDGCLFVYVFASMYKVTKWSYAKGFLLAECTWTEVQHLFLFVNWKVYFDKHQSKLKWLIFINPGSSVFIMSLSNIPQHTEDMLWALQ